MTALTADNFSLWIPSFDSPLDVTVVAVRLTVVSSVTPRVTVCVTAPKLEIIRAVS